MDILKTAMGMEQMSIKYYQELGEKVGLAAVRGATKLLVEEEEKHVQFIREYLADKNACLEDSDESFDIADIFFQFKNEIRSPLSIDNSILTLYQKGIEMEQKSIDLYEGLLGSMDAENDRAIIKKLILEEKKHKDFLEGLLDLTRTSEEWIEDPEFNHIGENY